MGVDLISLFIHSPSSLPLPSGRTRERRREDKKDNRYDRRGQHFDVDPLEPGARGPAGSAVLHRVSVHQWVRRNKRMTLI